MNKKNRILKGPLECFNGALRKLDIGLKHFRRFYSIASLFFRENL
jgi:hypothetical protein